MAVCGGARAAGYRPLAAVRFAAALARAADDGAGDSAGLLPAGAWARGGGLGGAARAAEPADYIADRVESERAEAPPRAHTQRCRRGAGRMLHTPVAAAVRGVGLRIGDMHGALADARDRTWADAVADRRAERP